MANALRLIPLSLVALLGCDAGPTASSAVESVPGASASASSTVTLAAMAVPGPPAQNPASASAFSSADPQSSPAPCPKGEVFIPATPPEGFKFRGGTGDSSARRSLPSQLPHIVVLTKPFCIDENEVTVRAYKECVDAGACKKPRRFGLFSNYPELLDHPVNKIPWPDATAYCRYRHQSLPTEAQWEWAATGGDDRKWAWGDESPTCKLADFTIGTRKTPSSSGEGCNGGGTSPVGTHPDGDRLWPGGRIHDLSGNVWEWCIDNYAPFKGGKEIDPVHMTTEAAQHVVRGGGWNRSARGIRVDYRGGAPVDYKVPGLGFRCARSFDAPPP